MSRHTSRSRARIDELAEELAIGAAIRLRTDSDEIRPIVDAVVAYLVEEYPSQDLYIPSSVTYPVDEILADLKAGRSMRWICNKYRTDRRTIYRLLDVEPALPDTAARYHGAGVGGLRPEEIPAILDSDEDPR